MGEIFSIETTKLTCFCEICIFFVGCRLDHCEKHGYMKGWKYVPLNPKGPHIILTWQEMHDQEVIISLYHDQVFDIERESMWPIYH